MTWNGKKSISSEIVTKPQKSTENRSAEPEDMPND
jgi:hypothetical protein